MQPYIPPEHPTQEVDIFLNEKWVDRWVFDKNNNKPVRQILTDYKSIKEAQLTIGFKFINPISPFSLRRGPDYRKLGFGLKDIHIKELI